MPEHCGHARSWCAAQVIYDSAGKPIYWEPQYSYRLDELANITTTCVPQNGTYLRSTPQG